MFSFSPDSHTISLANLFPVLSNNLKQTDYHIEKNNNFTLLESECPCGKEKL